MPHFENATNKMKHEMKDKRDLTRKFAKQAQLLAHLRPSQEDNSTGSTQASEAKFITAHDPVVETTQGQRLPAVPIDEALKLNHLKDELEGREPQEAPKSGIRQEKQGTTHGSAPPDREGIESGKQNDAPLREAVPPSRTNPLFPPLPMYGPPTWMRTLQCWFFRASSAVLSFCFLLTIVAGAAVTSVPKIWRRIRCLIFFQDSAKQRPFYEEEKKRIKARKEAEWEYVRQRAGKGTKTPSGESSVPQDRKFKPTEGGPDPLIPDVGYYARRVGLDCERFEVQTEDGFLIELLHLYDPSEYRPPSPSHHEKDDPDIFRTKSSDSSFAETQSFYPPSQKKYPILMMHGLLQSAGAYCSNDDDSLAFFLAKSGYDVWLGNNRCGFTPKHTVLDYSDPRMWAWNIRQMGVMDLPALISRVLAETGFPKLGLIAHSQGTTQTLVALAKEQRPEVGEKISVFCALAPAAYSGPLIGKMYFKIMRVISPALFRMIFGIHAFIPLMMFAHTILPANFYSWMGYLVFSFMFNWSDSRWDRGLRPRMFQFSPTFVSAESMRWWLGRECFAKQKCILATRDEGRLEDREDEEDDEVIRRYYVDREPHVTERRKLQRNLTSFHCETMTHQHHDTTRGKYAWYDSHFPPLALWVCGSDDLVDGRRLLRRFDRGREPFVHIVHKKIIEGYEHLDVIWAMDSIEKVGKEVREVIWRTASDEDRAKCRTPTGCEQEIEVHPEDAPGQMARRASLSGQAPVAAGGNMHSGGRARMPSITESPTPHSRASKTSQQHDEGRTQIDATKGEWARDLEDDESTIENAVVIDGAGEVEGEAEGRGERMEDEDEREFKGKELDGETRRRWSETEGGHVPLEEKGNPLG